LSSTNLASHLIIASSPLIMDELSSKKRKLDETSLTEEKHVESIEKLEELIDSLESFEESCKQKIKHELDPVEREIYKMLMNKATKEIRATIKNTDMRRNVADQLQSDSEDEDDVEWDTNLTDAKRTNMTLKRLFVYGKWKEVTNVSMTVDAYKLMPRFLEFFDFEFEVKDDVLILRVDHVQHYELKKAFQSLKAKEVEDLSKGDGIKLKTSMHCTGLSVIDYMMTYFSEIVTAWFLDTDGAYIPGKFIPYHEMKRLLFDLSKASVGTMNEKIDMIKRVDIYLQRYLTVAANRANIDSTIAESKLIDAFLKSRMNMISKNEETYRQDYNVYALENHCDLLLKDLTSQVLNHTKPRVVHDLLQVCPETGVCIIIFEMAFDFCPEGFRIRLPKVNLEE
jgi:hypothetical protein